MLIGLLPLFILMMFIMYFGILLIISNIFFGHRLIFKIYDYFTYYYLKIAIKIYTIYSNNTDSLYTIINKVNQNNQNNQIRKSTPDIIYEKFLKRDYFKKNSNTWNMQDIYGSYITHLIYKTRPINLSKNNFMNENYFMNYNDQLIQIPTVNLNLDLENLPYVKMPNNKFINSNIGPGLIQRFYIESHNYFCRVVFKLKPTYSKEKIYKLAYWLNTVLYYNISLNNYIYSYIFFNRAFKFIEKYISRLVLSFILYINNDNNDLLDNVNILISKKQMGIVSNLLYRPHFLIKEDFPYGVGKNIDISKMSSDEFLSLLTLSQNTSVGSFEPNNYPDFMKKVILSDIQSMRDINFTYNNMLEYFGQNKRKSFSDFKIDLSGYYSSVDEIDIIIGTLYDNQIFKLNSTFQLMTMSIFLSIIPIIAIGYKKQFNNTPLELNDLDKEDLLQLYQIVPSSFEDMLNILKNQYNSKN
jgi:hypothetical protein